MKNYILRNSLYSWRKLYGVTQKELADYLGVRRETISYIEKGDFHMTSIKFALMIADYFDCSVTDIFWLEFNEYEEKKS